MREEHQSFQLRGHFPHSDTRAISLFVGESRLRPTRTALTESDVKIALVHHAPGSEWYREDDKLLQRQELRSFDFVLRGHQHEPEARQRTRIAGEDDFIELAPGALRTQPHYYQGFMAVELDFRARLMRITAWTVTSRARKWVLDGEFGKDGVETRVIPQRLIDRVAKVSSKTG